MKKRKHEKMMIRYAQNPQLVVEYHLGDGNWQTSSVPTWREDRYYRLINPAQEQIKKEISVVKFETQTALAFGRQAAEETITELYSRIEEVKKAYDDFEKDLLDKADAKIKQLEAKL